MFRTFTAIIYHMNQEFIPILEEIEKALKKALPDQTQKDWQKLCFRELESSVKSEHIQNLITPCRSLMDLGGKRWRPLLMVLCYKMAQESGLSNGLKLEDALSLTPLVEFVHTASLIHDDIEDGADTRRGKPAAHITYGLDTALNAASWLYFLASCCIDKLSAPVELKNRFYILYATELRRLHLGQAMDIYWHRNPDLFPTIDEYKAMVHCKTGTLASLATQVGITAGGATEEQAVKAGEIAAKLGEGFQILDDVQNLTTGNPGKKRGDDIVEGKKSLPVLLHIQHNPEDKETIAKLFETARRDGIESPAVEECIHILEQKGAIQQAREQGLECIKQNSQNLANIFGTKASSKSAAQIVDLFLGMANA